MTPAAPLTHRAPSAVSPLVAVWCAVLALAAVDAAWLCAQGWSISTAPLEVLAIVEFGLLSPMLVPRWRRDTRLRTLLVALTALFGFQSAGGVFSYLVVSTGAPLRDAELAALDAALGFHWPAWHAFWSARPLAVQLQTLLYASGLVQIPLVVAGLALTLRHGRLAEFLGLFVATTVVTILLSGVLPAAGPAHHFGVDDAALAASLSHFAPLRDGTLRHVPLEAMQGLVSMPSLHAATSVLLAHALRGLGRLGAAGLALNIAMLLATPLVGGHYLVDVLAGAVLAGVLVALGARRPRPDPAPAGGRSSRPAGAPDPVARGPRAADHRYRQQALPRA